MYFIMRCAMKNQFKPTLATIEEEVDISEVIAFKAGAFFPYGVMNNVGNNIVYIKRWDSKSHRDSLLIPHKYSPKHSRNDPRVRYSYDRTSAGLHEFIEQRRKQMPLKSKPKSISEQLSEKHAHYKNAYIKLTAKQHHLKDNKVVFTKENHEIWERWASPKHQVTLDEIEKEYGARVKKWDSIAHKNHIIEQATKPLTYPFKHAVGDKTRRFSYEKSSEGLRDFLKLKRLQSNR